MTPQEAALSGRDLYAELGVQSSADAAAIKKAYRTVARTDHPDKKPGDAAAEERFKKASAAYEILSDDEKRKEYDEYKRYAGSGGPMGAFSSSGPRGPGGMGGGVRGPGGVTFNVQDLFGQARGGRGGGGMGDVFGGLFGGAQPQPGPNFESRALVSFDAALNGTTVTAGGSTVRIPAGAKDGMRLRVRGKGGPGRDGGPSGDLEVVVEVAPDRLFTRGENDRLLATVPVTFAEAALGATITVPTWEPSGRGSVTLKVPAGTRNGARLRVKGRGAPTNGRSEEARGDLIVTVEIAVPQKMTDYQKAALQAYAALEAEDVRAGLS